MGRRAKYVTAAERQQAQHAQQARYASSSLAKSKRAVSRKQHAELTANTVPRALAPELPEALITAAAEPFVFSYQYFEKSPGLGLWTAPFNFVMPTNEDLMQFQDDSAGRRLHSLQYFWVVAEGRKRRAEWTGKIPRLNAILKSAAHEVEQRLAGWLRLKSLEIAESDADRVVIHTVALQWGARIIVQLVQEMELRRAGLKHYRSIIEQSSLPWQMMMRSAEDDAIRCIEDYDDA
ncbi:hypothetical protein C8Q80DRAFT_1102861 [Daedaleopsis nitida]|nr:hypothetical protein C8Q80DRAFT_1102861 [Daedaleopsis nitida]